MTDEKHRIPSRDLAAIMARVLAKDGISGADLHRLFIPYGSAPTFGELKKKYGDPYVSEIYDGRAWMRHRASNKIDEMPGERYLWAYRLTKNESVDAVIRTKVEQWFYPSLPIEMMTYMANESVWDYRPIHAFGATALNDGQVENWPFCFNAGNVSVLTGHQEIRDLHAGDFALFTRYTTPHLARRAAERLRSRVVF